MIIDPYRFGGGTPPDPNPAAVTVNSVGSLRNDYGDYVGLVYAPEVPFVTITSVGRMFLAGNSGTRTIKGFLADNSVVFTETLDMTGGTPGQFQWVELAVPFTFSGGPQGSYLWIMSLETNGGDDWYNSTTGGCSIDPAVSANVSGSPYIRGGYMSGGNVFSDGVVGGNYGPVNFKWQP